MSRVELEHAWCAERLLDHAYGELAGRARRRVEAHLATCEACRAELAAVEGTRRALKPLPVEPAPARGEAALLAAARAAARARARPRAPRWLWATPALAGVAALTVVAVTRLGGEPWRLDGRSVPEAASAGHPPPAEREGRADAPAPPEPPRAQAAKPEPAAGAGADGAAVADPRRARAAAPGGVHREGARPAPDGAAQAGTAPRAAKRAAAPPAESLATARRAEAAPVAGAAPADAGALAAPDREVGDAGERTGRSAAPAPQADAAPAPVTAPAAPAAPAAGARAKAALQSPGAAALTLPFGEAQTAPGEQARVALSRWVHEGPAEERLQVTAYLEPGRPDAAERARGRAEAVAAVLRDAGVEGSRVVIATAPPSPCAGDREACAAAARRVVVTREALP